MTDPGDSPYRRLHESNILLFGSLALSFDAAAFEHVRRTVVESDENDWLLEVISGLRNDFETALSSLSILRTTKDLYVKPINDLYNAFVGTHSSNLAFPLPNTLLVPLTIIHHLTQYTSFLRQRNVEQDSRVDIWTAAKRGKETIGLCTGILSAFAVSSAHDKDEFHTYGAAAIRLGMLVGLFIDSQDKHSDRGRSQSLTAAWNSSLGVEDLKQILRDFPEVSLALPHPFLLTLSIMMQIYQ